MVSERRARRISVRHHLEAILIAVADCRKGLEFVEVPDQILSPVSGADHAYRWGVYCVHSVYRVCSVIAFIAWSVHCVWRTAFIACGVRRSWRAEGPSLR